MAGEDEGLEVLKVGAASRLGSIWRGILWIMAEVSCSNQATLPDLVCGEGLGNGHGKLGTAVCEDGVLLQAYVGALLIASPAYC